MCLICALEVPGMCPRERCFRGTLEVPDGRLGGAQQEPRRCLRGVLEVPWRSARGLRRALEVLQRHLGGGKCPGRYLRCALEVP